MTLPYEYCSTGGRAEQEIKTFLHGKTCFELALDKGVLQIGGQP